LHQEKVQYFRNVDVFDLAQPYLLKTSPEEGLGLSLLLSEIKVSLRT